LAGLVRKKGVGRVSLGEKRNNTILEKHGTVKAEQNKLI